MLLKIDKESLSDLNTNLKESVDIYNNALDSIMKTIDELHINWQGTTYNSFLTRYSNSSKGFIESKVFLLSMHSIIDNSLKNYINLSEGVHYNE